MLQKKKLLVVGGGAAGFFCAVNAARLNPQLEVILAERSGKLLSKVKVSGGGRCNVTHACFDKAEMSRRYPRGGTFVKKLFHQFFTTDTIQWFEERGARLKTEEDGRMFPVTDSSQTIIDCLLREATRYKVQIMMNAEVSDLLAVEDGKFRVAFSKNSSRVVDFVCIASGGFSRGTIFPWLQVMGHSIEPPVPSLFTFNMPGHPINKLMGISVTNAVIKIAGTKLEQPGPVLITHWGLSGPAILKLSAWGARELATSNYEFEIIVNWLPEYNEQKLGEAFQLFRHSAGSQKMYYKNPFSLPQRLWEYFLEHSGIGKEIRWADLPAKDQYKLVKQICSCSFDVKGKTTFKEEFVTAGGIRLNEIDHQTMMSKKIPGLFFAGEVMDVDGITGGYNFQHAWTSGFIAASAIAGYGQ